MRSRRCAERRGAQSSHCGTAARMSAGVSDQTAARAGRTTLTVLWELIVGEGEEELPGDVRTEFGVWQVIHVRCTETLCVRHLTVGRRHRTLCQCRSALCQILCVKTSNHVLPPRQVLGMTLYSRFGLCGRLSEEAQFCRNLWLSL